MTKKEMIALLNADLGRERQHLMFYLYAASKVRGPHREELAEFFTQQAASEAKHVVEFQNLILELGGLYDENLSQEPVVLSDFGEGMPAHKSSSPGYLLCHALSMEEEVVKNYADRLSQAAELGGVDGTYVALFMEDQFMHSKEDAAHIRRMLPDECVGVGQ